MDRDTNTQFKKIFEVSVSDELPVETVDITSDGTLLVCVSKSKISFLRTSPFEVFHEIVSKRAIDTAKLSPDGNFLAVGFSNGKIAIYDTKTFKVTSKLSSDFGGFWTLTWIRGAAFIAGGHYEPFISIFDISKRKRVQLLDPNTFDDNGRTATFFDEETEMLFSSARNKIISWSVSKNDKMKGATKFKLGLSCHIIDIAAFQNTMAGLANEGDQSRLVFWDKNASKKLHSINLPNDSKRLYWNTTENFIAIADDSPNGVSFWDSANHALLPYSFEDSSSCDSTSIVMCEGKKWLIVGTEFGKVSIWKMLDAGLG